MTTTAIARTEVRDLARSTNPAIEALLQHGDVMDLAYDLAVKLCRTMMVPTTYRGKPEDATAAILYGAELGLSPIQSLQQVIAVHGKPTVESRTMVALLKAKGYRFKTTENTATSATIEGTSPDGKNVETSTWTIEDAYLAEYVPIKDEKTGKYKLNSNGKLAGNMKYLTIPRQMLWAKAAAEVCRRLAPDVLLGIAYTREDLESEPAPVHIESERVDGPTTAEDILGAEAKAEKPSPKARIKDATPPAATPPPAAAPAAADVVIDDESVAMGQAAEAASNPVAKQDTPAPEAKVDEAKPAEVKPTSDQLAALHEVLTNEGLDTTPKKLAYLTKELGRKITLPNQLTPEEVDGIVGFLRTEQARDAGATNGEQTTIGGEA